MQNVKVIASGFKITPVKMQRLTRSLGSLAFNVTYSIRVHGPLLSTALSLFIRALLLSVLCHFYDFLSSASYFFNHAIFCLSHLFVIVVLRESIMALQL